MFASLVIAAVTATCPSNLATGLSPAPASAQLITVEASRARTTHATVRTWRRFRRCWQHVGGPYPALVGRNGLRKNRHEGDENNQTGAH